jgi:HEAT repeat protein
MRWLASTCAVLLLCATAEAGGYVVLSGVAKDDPYFAAAKRLAAYHGTQHVLRVDPQAPDAVLPRLREIEPEHVVIVLRPEQIDVNSVRRILRMSTRVDDDPFVDFDFGYVTGATAKDALAFVENIIRAGKTRRPRRVGSASAWAGHGASTASDDVLELGVLRFPERTLRFRAPEGRERDQAFLDRELPSLEGSGAILMGGHGMPWEIGGGPQAEDVGKLHLFPAVAFNYACYTGVTGRYPEPEVRGTQVVERFKTVEAGRSFVLQILRTGVTGYVAYVTPRPAGPELSTDFERVLAGASLGESRRTDYAKVALGYLGYGEPGIVPPVWTEGRARSRSELDPVRDMMLDGATGGILYGDPTLRPYPVTAHALPLRTDVTRAGDEFLITLEMPARATGIWCADPFRRFEAPGAEGGMARKLYDAVPLPPGAPEIRGVWIESAEQGGKAIPTLKPVWAVERDQGRRILHVKADFAPGGAGDVRVRLRASPRQAPPDFSDRTTCLDLARGVADHILADPALARTDLAVYDGAAGIAMFLFDLAQATGEARWRQAADAQLERALSMPKGAGLYTGLAGVGQVCLDAWWSTGDDAYLAKARACAGRLGAPQATDVISGAAGTGIFLLNLHAATGEPRWLQAATKLGDDLAARAVREDGRAHWPVSDQLARTYIGFSHGAAGIGTFLLQLGFATHDERFRALAEEAAAYVVSLAQDDGHGGWVWSKMPPPAENDVRLQWCHGSPGIALFFQALARGLGKPAYADALARSLAATRRGGRTARRSGCQCHGVAGNAEVLLEAWRANRDPALLAEARTWAADLVDEHGVKTTLGGRAYGPGYMTGLAGIGRFFLRLADPAALRLPMMVRDPGRSASAVAALVKRANDRALDARHDISALLASLHKAGPQAFEALVALIARGEGHWRTPVLLEATKVPGGERELMRLADGPPLARNGRWIALIGLGGFDTPVVRAYLLKRLDRETDAGLLMSAAAALGTLKEPRAFGPIARHLLAFEPSQAGIQPQLLAALVRIGGGQLLATLASFAKDERAVNPAAVALAVMQVRGRDPDAGRRLAKAVMASTRWPSFAGAWRQRIERAAR